MSYGLYIHLPFCRSKCPYCGFTSNAGRDDLIESYAHAVVHEIEQRCTGSFAETPQTIYIGGGTPSIVHPSYISMIMERFAPVRGREFTVEANPDSLKEIWLNSMLETGANRISIGIQSLDDGILKNLGRIHTRFGDPLKVSAVICMPQGERCEWRCSSRMTTRYYHQSISYLETSACPSVLPSG